MKTSDKAGIITIAQKLGISPATVSRALRPETAQLVKEERRKEILDLADKLHFTPNPGARSLRKGFSPVLSVIIPHDENIFFSEFYGRFLSGALHAAAPRGWDVRISTMRSGKHDEDFFETLQHLGMDSSGIIYLAEPLSLQDYDYLKKYRRPYVILKSALPADAEIVANDSHVIGVDNRAGAMTAASFLAQLGHRRIGLVLGPQSSIDARERTAGYLAALKQSGITPPPAHIFEGNFSHETGRSAFEHIFRNGNTDSAAKPTALCCASDEIAFGLIDAARAAGLRCPEDISVIGFDDGPWATVTQPKLTTIRQPLADLAERAVGRLVEMVNMRPGAHALPGQKDLTASLVIRESTQAIAVANGNGGRS